MCAFSDPAYGGLGVTEGTGGAGGRDIGGVGGVGVVGGTGGFYPGQTETTIHHFIPHHEQKMLDGAKNTKCTLF